MNVIKYYNCFFVWFLILGLLSFFFFWVAVRLLYRGEIILIYWRIFQINNSSIDFPIILDGEGLITSSIVLFISCNVFLFAVTYIHYEKFLNRFNILVLLFVLSINILIFIPNLIILLLGWDGLGLTRFLLVIYYQNNKSLRGGIITALTNRIGDAILLLAIGWSVRRNNWCITSMWERNYEVLIIISILIAAITKRAQIPFSRWLPAAIAAPTPVSALVHSSTLVTAGVFLLIRFYNFVRKWEYYEKFLLMIACLTMLIAALSAVIECDLKKIIALSTLSQLGVIIRSLAIGLPKLALFHLITHALFKALLFICAGRFIFLHGHNQDLRLVGNLAKQLPFTSACFSIGSLSLCGLPFLAGFYSKDLILEVMLSGVRRFVILAIIIVATGGTAFYRMRLAIYRLGGPSLRNNYHSLRNEDTNIILPCIFLTAGAIIGGAMVNWLFSPFLVEVFLPTQIKLIPLYFTILGGILGLILNRLLEKNKRGIAKFLSIHEFSTNIWFLTPLSGQISLKVLSPIYIYLILVDHGWVERIRAQGVWRTSKVFRQKILGVQPKIITIILNVRMFSLLLLVVLK